MRDACELVIHALLSSSRSLTLSHAVYTQAWGEVTVVEGVSSIREYEADESLPPPPVETGGYFTSQLALCIRLASLTRPFHVVESHVKVRSGKDLKTRAGREERSGELRKRNIRSASSLRSSRCSLVYSRTPLVRSSLCLPCCLLHRHFLRHIHFVAVLVPVVPLQPRARVLHCRWAARTRDQGGYARGHGRH